MSLMSLNYLVDASLVIEKLRVQVEVGLSHLKRNKRKDIDREELYKRVKELEDYVDGRVAELITSHSAYPWFSRVKGVGKENIGKVVAQIRVKPEKGFDKEGNSIDLPYADTISACWKFAGLAPVDGHSMKRVKGKKLEYNSQLRSMCWRLATSLMKATGCFYDYYIEEKDKLKTRYAREGIRILPTPPGHWMCDNCGQSWKRKQDIQPCCKVQHIVQAVKDEPEGVIWEGHLHNQALRKMIKLFMACLWLTWREAEGLPATEPYPIAKLGHTSLIDPWKMVDREAKEGD